MVKGPVIDGSPGQGWLSFEAFRVRARQQPARGVVLVHMGGPGFPYRASFEDGSNPVLASGIGEHFDVVGFDERGLGPGSELVCPIGSGWTLPTDASSAVAAGRRHAAACSAQTGSGAKLLTAMDSGSVAKDMEQLRRGLGVERWSMVGVSYGSVYVQQYLSLFPERVNRVVLDSPVDARATLIDSWVEQTRAIHAVAEQFVRWCSTDRKCSRLPGGRDGTVVQAAVAQYKTGRVDLLGLWPKPALFEGALGRAVGSQDRWPAVADVLMAVHGGQDGAVRGFIVEQGLGVSLQQGAPAPSGYDVEQLAAKPQVDVHVARLCSDGRVDEDDPGKYLNAVGEGLVVDELSGARLLATCSAWPKGVSGHPRSVETRDTQTPEDTSVLAISASGDSQAPCVGSARVSEQIPGSVLIVVPGVFHGVLNKEGSEPLTGAVKSFLEGGSTPRASGSCSGSK